MPNSRSFQTALLLTGSGACALIYQVTWLRELRLVFGSTTAASAAVVAIFMAGLGLGNALLGRRADSRENPLRYYAKLEFGITLTAALTPFLIDAGRAAYIGLGGQASLGSVGATIARLTLSSLVLLLPTVLMGGTLPAAVAAATTSQDVRRRTVGLLYGCNTLGAVVGVLASTFFLMEWLGTRATIWTACGLNLGIASLAHLLSRLPQAEPLRTAAAEDRQDRPHPARAEYRIPRGAESRVVYAAAGTVGFAFMLMELVWYRMLAPILGGTTYTFGLILAVALLGIGIGGAIYPLTFRDRVRPTLAALAVTCSLEALAIAFPFALGDRVACWTAALLEANASGFVREACHWFLIASVVVLPASIVSGVQFPLLIALLGEAKQDLGRQLGYTYAANTLGGIAGSLGGGFGLLPLLSAPGAWRMVVLLLVALSAAVIFLRPRPRLRPGWLTPLGIGSIGVMLILFSGPSAVWRHSGIGARRATIPQARAANKIREWENAARRQVVWERDGVEAGVAIVADDGIAFFVNGKSDGNAVRDVGTQVSLGLLPGILHPRPETCLVIGLGTGETAGWLARVGSVRRVDVVEVEPAVAEVARRCASANGDVLDNPKVELVFNDAREMLLTSRDAYDLIISEPSNPYRAGIASLLTREFYEAAASRLKPEGLFVQWLQAYEVDSITISSVFATLKTVFGHVEVWQSGGQDMLLVCSRKPQAYRPSVLSERIAREPYRTGFGAAWRATGVQGLLAHYIAGNALVEKVAAASGGRVNTDDRNLVEYGFGRTLGVATRFPPIAELHEQAVSQGASRPHLLEGGVDWEGVDEERMAFWALESKVMWAPKSASASFAARARALVGCLNSDYAGAVAQWQSQSQPPVCPTETALLALAYASLGRTEAESLADRLAGFDESESMMIRGILRVNQGRPSEAAAILGEAFLKLRADPWPLSPVTESALKATHRLVRADGRYAPDMVRALRQPFAVACQEHLRKVTGSLVSSSISPEALVPWLENWEPHVPWTEAFLKYRADAYSATGHALATRARADLVLFRRQQDE